MAFTGLFYSKQCIDVVGGGELILAVPSQRLEDRIRDLCAKVVDADEKEISSAISDLQSALREHNDRLRKLAFSKLSNLHERGRSEFLEAPQKRRT